MDAPSPSTAPESAVATIIPYKNGMALTAYYLGVFSIVCGAVLGIPALILGILGLQYAKKHPEAKGTAHAWIGIVLGGLMTLISLGAIVAFFVFAAKS
jgi:Domain of unknown function (DUF4190)